MADKSPNQINVENMQKRMHTIIDRTQSSTMCTAKWLQTTTTLYNGHTHSCHHPQPHKIPLEELSLNKTALHNTNHKKAARAQMLSGERPPECGYCWNIEDLPGEHVSDRVYKSTDQTWSYPFLDRVLDARESGDVLPTYFEVAFETTCNFKCVYCSPDVSSKWMEEIVQYGSYPTTWSTGSLDWLRKSEKMPIPNREANPYVDAFWEWWPELYKGLDTFRVTGGEPLLSKNMWKLLDYIKENPRKDFTLAINTNMQVPDHLIDRFIAAYDEIKPLIRDFQVFTSCEAKGNQADYIRFGMDYPKFMANVEKFLTNTRQDSHISFMITFNALSVPSFKEFLGDIYDLRVKYNQDDSVNRVPMMVSYLRWPPFLGMRNLPLGMREKYAADYLDFVKSRTRNTSPSKAGRFYLEEIDQIERLCEFMLTEEDVADLERNRSDFVLFLDEADRRRGTNFSEVFPELAYLLEEWNDPFC